MKNSVSLTRNVVKKSYCVTVFVNGHVCFREFYPEYQTAFDIANNFKKDMGIK